MPRINPEGQLTRKERLVTVIAIVAAVLFHLVALFGWGRIYRWTQEEQKKERLMVIRRVRDVSPPRDLPAEPSRPREAAVGAEGKAGGAEKPAAPPPPEPKVREKGPDPEPEPELSPAMEEDLQQQPDKAKAPEHGDNSVSVVTDLPAASFIVSGPAEYRGSGTFWVRKGAAPGVYSVTFNPVAGYATPALQSKELGAKGQIVFVGKYRRSTEIVVDSNESAAQFTIYRPDGRPIDLTRPGRAFLEDLPPGNYTAVFKDVPGHVTPGPITRSLVPGGKLSFFGEYGEGSGGGGGGSGSGSGVGAGSGTGTGARGTGSGAGGRGAGRGVNPQAQSRAGVRESELDRRVQLVVRSYPSTDIEDQHPPIAYPEIIIRKSNFQQGWCQVYLVLTINEDGEVEGVGVERPRPEDRRQFETLIRAVEVAVRAWDYDTVAAEVHVDVRFYVE